MQLNDVLAQSHQHLRQIIHQVQTATDDCEKAKYFTQLWQNFLVHEQAEESVAYHIMTEEPLKNPELSDGPLNFTVAEHHYFEEFVEHISTMPNCDDKANAESRNQLYQEFMDKLEAHMQHEEDYVFAQFAEQFDKEKHEQLSAMYLEKLREISQQQKPQLAS